MVVAGLVGAVSPMRGLGWVRSAWVWVWVRRWWAGRGWLMPRVVELIRRRRRQRILLTVRWPHVAAVARLGVVRRVR